MDFRVTKFGPSEAAEITGASTATQLNWRKRGFLPVTGGHARFDLFDLLKLTFVVDVGGLGIGPTDAFPSAEWVAHHALFYALAVERAVDGSAAEIAEREANMPPRGPHAEQDPELRALEDRLDQAQRIARVAFGRPGLRPVPHATLWSDGSDFFGFSPVDADASLPVGDARRGQPAITLDLPSFAFRVVSRLPRSAVVCVPEDD